MFKAMIKSDALGSFCRGLGSGSRGFQPLLAAMMAHRVTGALIGIIGALGFIGWVWTFVVAV
jgi:hypothetical protein